MKKQIIGLFVILSYATCMSAKEGMWLPVLIEKYNIGEMQDMGFKLSAEDVYDVNQACMKDAVMIFGGGCTGELISDKGLVITNHHCGFQYIQKHSSIEHDYLTDGFWAMSPKEELPNPGLNVKILKHMIDVTEEILCGVNDDMSVKERMNIISTNRDSVIKHATNGNDYEAQVNDFFNGNQYFLFVNEVFKDVRLVGAPPSSVGGFGGDIDNWMWPRHGGDFSLFRIYADSADNSPKSYSDNNVPYHPRAFFPISIKGAQKDDFTMVFGYPGSTNEYKTSYHLKMLSEQLYPELVSIRGEKLEVIDHHMNLDAERRIKYAAKAASISNSWKRWRGELKGIDRFKVVQQKEAYETDFNNWAKQDNSYNRLIQKYQNLYTEYSNVLLDANVLKEIFEKNSMECFSISNLAYNSFAIQNKTKKPLDLTNLRNAYKDFDLMVDRDLTVKMLSHLYAYANKTIIPPTLDSLFIKHDKDVEKITEILYKQTIVKDSVWLAQSQKKSKKIMRALSKDLFRKAYSEYNTIYNKTIRPQLNHIKYQIDSLDRIYMKALMAFDTSHVFYPDANFTLRITYGKVDGYEPKDGVYYKYFTTAEGILEKDNPEIYDYNLPKKLRTILKNRDYGKYAENDSLHICFIATNHTTGGNSGSPVLNADGHLIGLNFDRAWDGVMSDLYYNPIICRNISVDIRYILFIIDKFAGAGYLLDEMEIIEQ